MCTEIRFFTSVGRMQYHLLPLSETHPLSSIIQGKVAIVTVIHESMAANAPLQICLM